MNGIIIVNQSIGHNEYKINRYKEEFKKLSVDIDVFVNNGTLAQFINNSIVVNLPKADFVIYLDKDIYLAKMLEKCGYKLFNDPAFLKLCDDKVLTYIECANKGIRMIKTFAGPLVYHPELKETNYDFLAKVSDELGFPMIVKKVYGSLGEGIYKVNDMTELRNLYASLCRNPILFQQYIKSSCGKSMRVMIIDKKVIGGFVRYNNSDFRSNYGDSADGKRAENCEEFFAFAQDVADKLNIFYAGIDLLFDENNKPILCEINSNAFFEEFEKVTNINVARIHCESIVSKIGRL